MDRAPQIKFASTCEFARPIRRPDATKRESTFPFAQRRLYVTCILEQEAKARQKEHGETAPGKKSLVEKFPQMFEGEACRQAANMMKVNARYVSDAKQIQDAAPELFAQILKGEKSITKVKRDRRFDRLRTGFRAVLRQPIANSQFYLAPNNTSTTIWSRRSY